MRSRLLGALLGVVLSVAATGGAPPAAAQSSPQATLQEAERLDKQSKELAAQKKWSQAAAALEKAIALQVAMASKLDAKTQTGYLIILAGDSRRLAGYYTEAGDYGRAVQHLERTIMVYEKMPASSDQAKDLPRLKQALADLKKLAGGSTSASTSKPAAASAPAPSAEEQLVEKTARAIALWQDDKTSEAAVLMDSILPSIDASSKLPPQIVALANLAAARIYHDSAQLSKAEVRFKKTLEQHERIHGKSGKALVDVLKAFGDFYASNHEPERAVPHTMRAFDIAKAERPERVAALTLDLAQIVAARGDHAEAAVLAEKARALFLAKAGGAKDDDYLVATLVLAGIEEERNRFSEAEALYEEVRAELEPRYRATPSKLGPLWAGFLSTYGWHHRKRESWSRAEGLFKEALALKRTIFKNDSLVVANAECSLGEVYWASGDLPRSLDPIQRCFDARDESLSRLLATGSEEQKRASLSAYLIAYQKTLTAQLLSGNGNGKMTRLGLGQVLRTKGRVLDAMSGESQAIRRGASPEQKALLDRLAATRTLLAQESQSGRNAARVQQLEEEARTLEQKIAEKSEAFRSATKKVDVDAVRAAIPRDHALVEIVAFDPLDPKYKRIADAGATRYLAYVVHGKSGPEPTVVDLGPAAAVDVHVKALRAALGDPDSDPSAPARELYERVVLPLEPSLRGIKKLIVSPDGALNAVPFAAFAKDGRYLVESYAFSYVTSGRDLLRWGASRPRSDSFVVVADPDFTMNGAVPPPGTRFASVKFPPLPGTDTEAKAIKRMFKGATLLTKRSATEQALKNVAHPQVLHVATHGFFLKGEPVRLTSTRGLELDMGEAQKSAVKTESPLLRSGLALAGASSLSGGGGQDGILTALEATSLDLVGTRLVVLSACQTAEGETQNGEGVYGLRRALSIAGAETLVMSLWSVDDEATSFLMQRYYDRLKKGGGRADALRDTQVEMVKAKAVSHPYYWAAFIPSGETSPMDLPRDPAPGSRSSKSSSFSSSSPRGRDTSSSDDILPDVGRRYDMPFLGGTFGLSRISLTPTGAAPPGRTALEGDVLHVGFDVNLLSLLVHDVGISVRRGFALYDRAAISLAGVSMGGEDVGGNQLDYSAMLGYRTRFIGLFGGVMLGTGSMAFDDDFRATGPFVPAAARVELPWWWGSRLTANAHGLQIAGVREVVGVDARMPLFTPDLWLGVRYDQLRGRSDQVAEAKVMTFSLGIGESRP